jgi:4-hydroxy-tetrahydrodipicolinate synthase
MAPALRGVQVALATPFDAEDHVDEPALRRLVDDQVAAGIHGIIVNGSTGEFTSLSAGERRRVVKVALEAADGRVPVIAQVGAMTANEAAGLARHALDAGAFAGMLVTPWYEGLGEQEVLDYVEAVSDTGLPIMLYNLPAATGLNMSPEFLVRVVERAEGVRYLKDTTGDVSRIHRIEQLLGSRLQVLNGQDTLALVAFLAGTQASVWGAPNAAPRSCAELFELAVARQDLAGARELWRRLFPLQWLLEHGGNYIGVCKAAARLRGVDVGDPRRPLVALDDAGVEQVARLLADLGEISPVGAGA